MASPKRSEKEAISINVQLDSLFNTGSETNPTALILGCNIYNFKSYTTIGVVPVNEKGSVDFKSQLVMSLTRKQTGVLLKKILEAEKLVKAGKPVQSITLFNSFKHMGIEVGYNTTMKAVAKDCWYVMVYKHDDERIATDVLCYEFSDINEENIVYMGYSRKKGTGEEECVVYDFDEFKEFLSDAKKMVLGGPGALWYQKYFDSLNSGGGEDKPKKKMGNKFDDDEDGGDEEEAPKSKKKVSSPPSKKQVKKSQVEEDEEETNEEEDEKPKSKKGFSKEKTKPPAKKPAKKVEEEVEDEEEEEIESLDDMDESDDDVESDDDF